jgi:hypothetical protein
VGATGTGAQLIRPEAGLGQAVLFQPLAQQDQVMTQVAYHLVTSPHVLPLLQTSSQGTGGSQAVRFLHVHGHHYFLQPKVRAEHSESSLCDPQMLALASPQRFLQSIFSIVTYISNFVKTQIQNFNVKINFL